ncbi:MAG: hypothetical protein RSD29_03455, partial [Bacilli bacterium]
MKKIKHIIISIVFVATFFIGTNGIFAKTYTAYNVGDLITVNVNDTEKLEFYVISESKSNTSDVTAIAKNNLGDPIIFNPTTKGLTGSDAEKSLNQLTSKWTNLLDKRLIYANEVFKGLGIDETLYSGYNFTTPAWARINDLASSYFTQTVVSGQTEAFSVFVVNGYPTYSNLISVYSSSSTPAKSVVTAHIRPVITISKDRVVNGNILDESDIAWTNFVNDFRKGDIIYYFEKFKYIITIDDTPNSLKITTDTLKKKFLTNFNYNNGILEYVYNPNLENSFSDFIWIGQALESFTNIKKYDYTDFNNWFGKQDQNALTIPKDGIELKTEKVEYDNGNGIATGDRFLVFKVDLVNGLKTYVPSVKTETKPETKVDVTVDTETTV